MASAHADNDRRRRAIERQARRELLMAQRKEELEKIRRIRLQTGTEMKVHTKKMTLTGLSKSGLELEKGLSENPKSI